MAMNRMQTSALSPARTVQVRGFTLIELAIVLFVVALLLGGMLLPLSGQQDIRNYGDTQKILAEARDALLGYAMANERLPCPASATSNGMESLSSPGVCTNPHSGFLPAATLGLSPVDPQGYRLDGWGGEPGHRVRCFMRDPELAEQWAGVEKATWHFTGDEILAPILEPA